MNRVILILMVLGMTVGGLWAQEYIEIGTGETTTNFIPAYGSYDYGWSNYILTSDQIGNAIDINEIKFNVGNTPSYYTMYYQKLYLKHTSASEVASSYPNPADNGFTLVYSGSVTWNGSGWQGVNFQTEFSYDGTSNLQIVWINNDGSGRSSNPNFKTTNTEVNTSAYNYAENTLPTSSGSYTSYFPNTRLGFYAEDFPSVPTIIFPEMSSYNNGLDTELVWSYGENTDFIQVYLSESKIDVQHRESEALVFNSDLATSFSPTLENASVYYWKVVASNSTTDYIAQTPIFSFSTNFGDNSGSGSPEDPYLIDDIDDLILISNNEYYWDKHFLQTNDIDATATSELNDEAGFSPIGNNSTNFTGSYNGQGHTISNLYIYRPSTNYVGLFGYTQSASISNLGIVDAEISGGGQVGGLVGYAYSSSTISESYATGAVSGSSYVGGLVGYAYSSSTISNSYATGAVSGSSNVGGLVGSAYPSSTISNSYATGAVSGTSSFVGGLVGSAYSSSTISESYATGAVSGSSYVGGLVGYAYSSSTISNSYATGAVSGTSSFVGGLVGSAYSSNISNSYATGAVNGTGSYVGGLVGYRDSGSVNNSFWDRETSGRTSSAGGTGKTTLQMKHINTYLEADWDFTSTWLMYSDFDMYPKLKSITDFHSDSSIGYAPLTVHFRGNSSLESPSEWLWDFGDGATSTDQNPSHQYTSVGTYTITMLVSDGQQSYTVIKPNYITTRDHQNNFQLIAPSTFSTDMDVFPKFEWESLDIRDSETFHYKVYISTNPSFSPETTVIYSTPKTYLYPPQDLIVNTTYFWKVIACFENDNEIVANMGGQSFWMLSTVAQISQTHPMINGTILDHRTLRRENSPYWLDISPATAPGVDLTIGAGVVLRFNSQVGLTLEGNFYSLGTEADSVVFEGYTDNTLWSGVNQINHVWIDSLFVDDETFLSGNLIKHTLAKDVNGIFINCPNTDIYVSNSTFSNIDRAFNCGEASYFINNNFSGRISGTGTAITGGTYFSNNIVTSFFNGIECSYQAILDSTQVISNRGYGIKGGMTYSNCTIQDNGGYGIICNTEAILTSTSITDNNGNGVTGGSIYTDCVISDNEGYGVNGGSQFINCTVSNNGSYGIICNTEAILTSTSITDNNGNGVTGGSIYTDCVISDNEGYGVNGGSSFTDCVISDNQGYGVNGGSSFTDCVISDNQGYGVNCNPLSVFETCTISNNSDYAVNGGNSFTDCNFSNNRGVTSITVAPTTAAIFSNNLFQNNISSRNLLSVTADSLVFENNDIGSNSTTQGNYYMLHLNAPVQAVITSNDIVQNSCQGMLLSLSSDSLSFIANTVLENQINGYSGSTHAFKFTANNLGSLIDNNITQNTFRDNLIEFAGSGSFDISDNVLSYNNGLPRRGLSITKCMTADVLIQNNTISFNQLLAPTSGKGVIWAYSGNVTIDRNTLTYNSAVNRASVLYVESTPDCSITNNLITYNTGEFAIWGNPTEIQNNNIYNNKNSSEVNNNIRHTTSDNKNYIYNFWGTRSDQGNINPTLYHNNYDSNLGVITYQPIRTSPSPNTPGQLTIVDNVMVPTNEESLVANTVGIYPNSTFNLCLVGEDGNSYSRDLTDVNITNINTGYPLQPFLWETGANTGIFRGTIAISDTGYNPQQNILRASIGDTLRIQSTVDPSKVFFIPVIEPRPILVLPESFTFEEDNELIIDMNDYTWSLNNDSLSLLVQSSPNILAEVQDMIITLTATANWYGSEIITITVDDGEDNERNIISGTKQASTLKQRDSTSASVEIIVTPVNDSPILELPESFTFIENNELIIDMSEYVSDIDNDPLTLEVTGGTNIMADIQDMIVTLTATSGWSGSEMLTFTVDDGHTDRLISLSAGMRNLHKNQRISTSETVEIIVIPENDAPTIETNIEEEINFGTVYLTNASEYEDIIITNNGTGTLTISEISCEESAFNLLYDSADFIVEPNSSMTLQVNFAPDNPGTYLGDLVIANNSSNEPNYTLTLRGFCQYIPPADPDGVQVNMANNTAQLSWDPVTEDIYENPVTPDLYIVYYNGRNTETDEDDFYYHGNTTGLTYSHHNVGIFSEFMFYRVKAYVDVDNAVLSHINDLVSQKRKVSLKEVESLISNRKGKAILKD